MTDAIPSFETFDIVAVLAGREYPEVAVPFYLDEVSALALSRGEKELTKLELLEKTEEYQILSAKVEALREKLRADKYTWTLRGIPNKVRSDLLDEAYTLFPRVTDNLSVFQTEKPNDARDQWFATHLLHAMTAKIESPTGAVMENPNLGAIQSFRDHAPQAALTVIYEAQSELADGVKAGFEQAAQDTDFS